MHVLKTPILFTSAWWSSEICLLVSGMFCYLPKNFVIDAFISFWPMCYIIIHLICRIFPDILMSYLNYCFICVLAYEALMIPVFCVPKTRWIYWVIFSLTYVLVLSRARAYWKSCLMFYATVICFTIPYIFLLYLSCTVLVCSVLWYCIVIWLSAVLKPISKVSSVTSTTSWRRLIQKSTPTNLVGSWVELTFVNEVGESYWPTLSVFFLSCCEVFVYQTIPPSSFRQLVRI